MNMNMNMPYQMNNYNSPYQQHNGINWVQGVEGAKAYQLMPNSNAMLLDSENDGIFYIKISDNVGMCSLRTFKYEELTDFGKHNNNVDLSQYITREELESILDKRLSGGKSNAKQSIQSTKSTITE